jgi:hypothetical protein
MLQLQEKDVNTKMELLFKKNLFPLAINLAHSQNCDQEMIVEILKSYGDHLYR